MTFPQQRLRRLRKSGAIRRLISEITLSVDDFVAPLFVREGISEPQPIASLPGVFQHTRDSLKAEIDQIRNLGIPSIILFGIPAEKDATGSGAWDPNGIVQQAIADCKSVTGDDLVIMSDLCVAEYTCLLYPSPSPRD